MNFISRISTLLAALALAAAPFVPAAAYAESADATINTSVNANALGLRPALNSNVSGNASVRADARVGSTTVAERRTERQASTTAAVTAHVQAKSDTELDARIKALQQVSARIAGEKNLSAGDLATLQASVTSEIGELTSLKAQIDTDTSTTTLKGDASSITKAYRIYMLVIPQDKVTSGADRVLAVAAQMQALSAKFATRISAADSVSAGVTNAKADYDAKVADAQTQANAAVSLVVGLKPDGGDKNVMASNTTALKAALKDIEAAQSDLRTARQDAYIIMQGIAGKAGSKETASTTASGN